MNITESIKFAGVNDKTIDLFESQYKVKEGVSYNSYVILDDKIAIMDTVDGRATDEWLSNIKSILGEKTPDYLIVSHMEPDHGANIGKLATLYPNMKIVGNAKTFNMINQFFELDLADRKVEVKEGETLILGVHILQFFMAPMVHWPEVMVTYEQHEKILFSADGFGKFGTIDTESMEKVSIDEWSPEAARYYYNIVGKYGAQVQSLLKKAATLDINMICPLHGPILNDNLAMYIEKYNTWSSYKPEIKGVLIAFASIHGNTKAAAKKMAAILEDKGGKVVLCDLSRQDMSENVKLAFQYEKVVLAAATYDGGIFPCMEDFLLHLKSKNYQSRTIGLIENGSWAPASARLMKTILECMKNITVCEQVVSIKSTMKDETVIQMEKLANEIV